MKNKIIEFLKKNAKYLIILLVAIAVIVYSVIRESRIITMTEEKVKLELRIDELQNQRQALVDENEALIQEKEKISREKDFILLIKEQQEKELEKIKIKHKKEIDSLLNIPDDTVYVRLQPIYPNYDNNPLKYPFSGSQIRQIYTTAISYPMLQKEYSLQSTLLTTCNTLNKTYEASEANYKAQVDNLNKQISNCDQQIGLKDSQLKITQRQLNKKTFWNWTQKGLIVVITTIAIFK